MSEVVEQFHISRKIELKLRKSIRLFYVFHNFHRRHNVLFITSKDKVYSFGFNKHGVCGVGHQRELLAPEEVRELREKNIEKFVNGENFVLALSSDRRMYGWGSNCDGQLAQKDLKPPTCYKPVEISFFLDRDLTQVKCGMAHSLALTADGHLYAWGDNISGQIGIGQQRLSGVSTIRPVANFSRFRVKSVFCAKNVSFALMENGQVYSWGCNVNYMCGHRDQKFIYLPRLVNSLSNVIDICTSFNNTYAVTEDGKLLICGTIHTKFQKEFKEISISGVQFKALLAFGNNYSNMEALALTNQGVYKMVRHHVLLTPYPSFSEYCTEVHKITAEPITLTVENRVTSLMTKAFDNKSFYDLKIKLKKLYEEEFEYIHVHKWFITESIDYFRGMFDHNWKESGSNEVEINGYSYEAYYQFLQWIYTDSIDATDVQILLEMLYLSEEYVIKEFKLECIDQIRKIEITKEDCDLLNAFAVEVKSKELEDLCLEVTDKLRISIEDKERRGRPTDEKAWWRKTLHLYVDRINQTLHH